jgi:hypothetical protein
LLRISEFTAPSARGFNHRIHATRDSIQWGSKGSFAFHIKQSKTDQLCRGHDVHIMPSGGRLCPVKIMRRYLHSNRRHKSPSPLFTYSDNKPLTRHSCLKHLRHLLRRAGYSPQLFNTHSFRIGGATHAAHLGMPSHHIKLLGRWRSTAYQRYTRCNTTTTRRAASHLASSFVNY